MRLLKNLENIRERYERMIRDYTFRDQLVTTIHQFSNVENANITKIVLSEEGYELLKKAAQNPKRFTKSGEFYTKPYTTDSITTVPVQLYNNGTRVYPRYNYQI